MKATEAQRNRIRYLTDRLNYDGPGQATGAALGLLAGYHVWLKLDEKYADNVIRNLERKLHEAIDDGFLDEEEEDHR